MSALAYYELVDVLGEGAMGRVYRGTHHPSGLAVAVKTLHADYRKDRVRRRLILDEATAAAKLEDPRIVRLVDLGRDEDGTPFLVMELARGRALDHMLTRWAGWPAISRALSDILEGLRVAHATGIVHRDLKPANVLVDPDTGQARVLDFGVAQLIDPLKDRQSKGIVGTPEFMPPEQLSGDGPIGPWTDLYAFGVILSIVVRGDSPFAHFNSLPALLVGKGTYVPSATPPVRAGLSVPRGMQELIDRLIRPHPRARPRFAIEVARDFAAYAANVIDDVPERPTDPTEELEDESSKRETMASPDDEPSGLHVRRPDDELVLPARLPAVPNVELGAALARLREVPMVGRESERAELVAVVKEVIDAKGARLVAYLGEGGIGKSRLARWGLAEVERHGIMEGAAGGYDPSGADVAGGLRHALRRLLGMPVKGWRDSWGWLAGEPGLDLDRLARFLRADEDQDTMAVDAVVSLAHTTLRAAGRMRPIYLWLDDLAWARDGALSLVENVLVANDVPILIVVTMRPGAAQHGAQRGQLARILRHRRSRARHLPELTDEERAALLDKVAPLAPGVAKGIAERTEGSPLLLVQLVHDWIARDLLVPSGSVYAPRDGSSVDELLAERSLTMLVDDRVEDLLEPFGERQDAALAVLGRAALLGARFEELALKAACAHNKRLRVAMDEVLDRALMVGILRSERGRVYAFDHGLLHEAFIDRIARSKEHVGALVDAANGLQARYGKERADIAAVVAGLLYRAGDFDRAWERQLRAIERAAWASDDRAAMGYLAVARQWVGVDPDRTARLEQAEALAHYYALRYDVALEHVGRARRLAADLDDEGFAHLCDATEADIVFYQDRFAASEALAKKCLVAGNDEDPEAIRIRAKAAQRLAEIAVLRGDFADARKWYETSVDLAVTTGIAWRVRVARLNLAEILAVTGNVEGARTICTSVLDEARRERDEDSAVAVLEVIARIDVLDGKAESTREFFDARCATLSATHDQWRFSAASAFRALIAAELDDDATLEAYTREHIAAFAAVPHDEAFTSAAMRTLATKLEDRGRFDLAREVDALLEGRSERFRDGFRDTAP